MTRSPSLVKADIARLQNEIGKNEYSLPPLGPLQAKVSALTTKALINIEAKSDLILAAKALDDAQTAHALHEARKNELVKLQAELVEAERHEAQMAREQAAIRMQNAHSEFVAHSKAAALAYVKLFNAARAAGNTSQLPKFHCSSIYPISWQGTVSDAIQQGTTLPFMNEEKAA